MKHITTLAPTCFADIRLPTTITCLDQDLATLKAQKDAKVNSYMHHCFYSLAARFPKRDFYVDHGMGCLTVEIVPKGAKKSESQTILCEMHSQFSIVRVDGTKHYMYGSSPLFIELNDILTQFDMYDTHIKPFTTAAELKD